ncbi:MAG: hypothetical protein WDZ29_05210 [Balneolaceae bacterium]
MSNEQIHTREFRARTVLEAVSGELDPATVAEKYGISPDELIRWAEEMDLDPEQLSRLRSAAAEHHSSGEEVWLDVLDDQFSSEVETGVASDYQNMSRLNFWTVLGVSFVLLTILSLMAIYSYHAETVNRNVSEQSQYYEVRELQERDQEHLDSYGITDLDNGLYHIPIDESISRMVEEQ